MGSGTSTSARSLRSCQDSCPCPGCLHAPDDSTGDIALVAARDPAAPRVGIVVVDRIDDIGDPEAIVLQLLGIEIELVFGGEAAEIIVIDDAGNGLQRRNHGPAL